MEEGIAKGGKCMSHFVLGFQDIVGKMLSSSRELNKR